MILQGKTLFITGSSRGIGRAIALKAAQEGANVVIAAKTVEPHPHLSGTIHSVAEEIRAFGGRVLPLAVDIRFEDQIKAAVEAGVQEFGGIDLLVNNASAISLTPTLKTDLKKFDLMFDINVRGTFAVTQACLPYLFESSNPHILMISPPLNLNPKWFANHGSYTMSKYGMSLWVLGMAEEFKSKGVAVNALWPKTIIATAAIEMVGGEKMMKAARKPEIVADAALLILTKSSKAATGQFFIDEELLRSVGIQDFSTYAVEKDVPLIPDLFLDRL